jgi:uncharacterized coiled-coil protein SlyX
MGTSLVQKAKDIVLTNQQTGAISKQVAVRNMLGAAKTKGLGFLKPLITAYTIEKQKIQSLNLVLTKKQLLMNRLSAHYPKVALGAKKMGAGFVAAGKKILVMMAKLLASPLVLLVALGGIVVALKKISEATDTTNPMIAEFQIRIKKASAALKEIIEGIKEFFGRIMRGEGILGKFFKV